MAASELRRSFMDAEPQESFAADDNLAVAFDVNNHAHCSESPLSGTTEVASNDFCETPCRHHPISSKYPNPLHLPHADNLNKFIRDVSRALQGSYPRIRDSQERYDRAHALFLRWEEDQLGVQEEIDDLLPLLKMARFTASKDSFTTAQYNILSEDSEDLLEEILVQHRNKHAIRASDLLLVYYGGHGEMTKDSSCKWYPWIRPPPGAYVRPEIDWSSLQRTLQKCAGDVVFILDCCYSSSMASGSHTSWKGFKELLVATGKHEKTDGVSDKSFTRALIGELRNLRGKACTISGLQATLVEKQDVYGLRNTPIRIGLSDRANRFESLVLDFREDDEAEMPIEALDSFSLSYNTRVLISIRLRQPANPLMIDEWIPWLKKQAPSDILDMDVSWTDHIRLEAGFDHGSTLLFFSLPLSVWNVLPEQSSYNFIDLIKSGNLVRSRSLRDLKRPDVTGETALWLKLAPVTPEAQKYPSSDNNTHDSGYVSNSYAQSYFTGDPLLSPGRELRDDSHYKSSIGSRQLVRSHSITGSRIATLEERLPFFYQPYVAFGSLQNSHRNIYGMMAPYRSTPLHIVLFKNARAVVCDIERETGLSIKPGDLVIIKVERGIDLGTVAAANLDLTQAITLKEHYAKQHNNWLNLYSRVGLDGSAAFEGNPNLEDIKPRLITRLAMIDEIHTLRDKERKELKAKHICIEKAQEHGLKMQIVDAEFQIDYNKLTFYYLAESYINFKSLVTDLFKIFKTRIWMSSIAPPFFPGQTMSMPQVPRADSYFTRPPQAPDYHPIPGQPSSPQGGASKQEQTFSIRRKTTSVPE